MWNFFFRITFSWMHILPIIIASCPDIPEVPDIVTFNSNQKYPRFTVRRELQNDRVVRRQINSARRIFQRIRKKRNAELNALFEENTVDTANRFILNFLGFDTSRRSGSLPAGTILSPPIEVSHDEFLALKEKHGGESAGSVVDITEDEFNEIASNHGVGFQQTVQTIEVPHLSDSRQWQTISSGDFTDWKPVQANDQIMASSLVPGGENGEKAGISAEGVPDFLSNTGGIIEKTVEFIDVPISSDKWRTASSAKWVPVPFNSKTVQKLSPHNDQSVWTNTNNGISANVVDVPVFSKVKQRQSVLLNGMTDVISVGANGERHSIRKQNVPGVRNADVPKSSEGVWQTRSRGEVLVDWVQSPVVERTQSTCSSMGNSISLKNRVNFKNTNCWILPGFRNHKLSFVECSKKSCSGTAPVGVGDEDMCTPSSLKRYDVWLYCEKLVRKLQRYELELPQTCKCKRFNCFNK